MKEKCKLQVLASVCQPKYFKLFCVLFIVFIPGHFFSLYSQLTVLHNMPRYGDYLVKQQVDYKEPGRTGENVVWNFGQLKVLNSEYIVSYDEPPVLGDSVYVLGRDTLAMKNVRSGELIVGTEHFTRYYYRLKGDSLLLLGYENPGTWMRHWQSQLQIVFPCNYGDKYQTRFCSDGLYSGTIPLKQEGQIQLHADAFGVMILPSGDTLLNVLRVKSVQDFLQTDSTYVDSLSVKSRLKVEHCRWYARGYRYPVFETIRSVSSEQKEVFSSAFFYPPLEHHYIYDDDRNQEVLALLENNGISSCVPAVAGGGEKLHFLTYNYYPNPVRDHISIEFRLEHAARLSVAIFDVFGQKILSVPDRDYEADVHVVQFQTSALPTANYVLKFILQDEIVSTTIVKL